MKFLKEIHDMKLIKRIYHSVKTALCYKQNFASYYEPQLLDRYNQTDCQSEEKVCIYTVDGTDYNPGLCDRLRGILSIFYLCTKTNIPFKINWIYPFELTDYLIPNEYNWGIKPTDIKYCKNTKPIVIDYATYLLSQEFIDKITFKKRIQNSPYFQLHVYSNTIVKRSSFKGNFNKLFKPSQKLIEALSPHKIFLGENYISFSLRFMELLGDFKDQEGVSTPLSKEDQTKLIEKCADKLLSVLNEQPKGTKAFVASDSVTFINYISKRDSRIYVVPGEIVHIRYKGSEEAYLKTFVDLYLLKGATTQYLLKTGSMYNSGFPRFASWIGNNDFRLIEF